MSFKIVATRSRRGGTEISLCPTGWERAGKLAWPPQNISSLQNMGSSVPEEHWQKFDCVVKKRNIPSYKEALYWETTFQNVDTEEESELTLPVTIERPQPRETLKEINLSNNPLDNMFEGIHNAAAANVVQSYESNNMEFKKQSTNPVMAPDPPLLDLPIFQFDGDLQTDISSRLDVLQVKVGSLQEEIAGLKQAFFDYRIQQNVTSSKMLTMMEKIVKDNGSRRQELEEIPQTVETEDFLSKYCLPINDLEELRKLDKDLNINPEFFKAMENHFNTFIGTDGQGRGEVLGKQMAEQIMSRNLMTEMSWTGVSRTEGLPKKFAFQSLETLIKLFYCVLLKADSRWSNQKNEKLFNAALLKHAKKRATAEKMKLLNKKNIIRASVNGPSGDGNAEQEDSPELPAPAVVPPEASPKVPNEIEEESLIVLLN